MWAAPCRVAQCTETNPVADPRPRAETIAILDRLEQQHPNANTELNYRTPFELLIATILSAQSTDARVNLVTPTLFAKYPDARALAAVEPEAIEPLIISTGFFRSKSRSIVGAARALVERHRSEVPADMAALVELPGVGRKTANVVLGHALGVPGLPVDRHVLRVANRLGIAASDDPEVVEQQLCAALPKKRWTRTSDVLILHGRRVCRPTPLCDRCNVRDLCRYYAALSTPPAARARRSKAARAGRGASPAAGKRGGKRSAR
jgi:endonuclease III